MDRSLGRETGERYIDENGNVNETDSNRSTAQSAQIWFRLVRLSSIDSHSVLTAQCAAYLVPRAAESPGRFLRHHGGPESVLAGLHE
jgi:hypothetical protein